MLKRSARSKHPLGVWRSAFLADQTVKLGNTQTDCSCPLSGGALCVFRVLAGFPDRETGFPFNEIKLLLQVRTSLAPAVFRKSISAYVIARVRG